MPFLDSNCEGCGKMKQAEIAKYLKAVTIGITLILLVCVVWFVPSLLKDTLMARGGPAAYWSCCGFFWLSATPFFLVLWRFWSICERIGRDESFSIANAQALKKISHYMLLDGALYALFLLAACVFSWHLYLGTLIFGVLLILFICVTVTVLAAALSHLVYKASKLQEEHDLTI